MNKILSIYFLLICFSLSAQKNEVRSKIDSINQTRWTETLPNLDSLSNPTLIKMNAKLKDTIVLKKEPILTLAPQQEMPLTPFNLMDGEGKRWFVFGQNSLLFNQASFKNWISGGDNNVGVISKVNYNIIYRYRKHYLENIFLLGYGFVSTQDQHPRKTEDYISLMSNYGYELGNHYYLSAGMQFRSQFMPGYNYNVTPDPSYTDRTSKFFAPAYVNVGIGVSYNPKENFQIIFRPITGKFTIVADPLLQKAGQFGLERDGQIIKSELGALTNVVYRLKIMEGMNLDNQLNVFTNYLDHPERIDISYKGDLNIKFNKYISTVFSIELIYDHDQVARLQRKQTLGVGILYNIGQNVDKEKSKKILKPLGVK